MKITVIITGVLLFLIVFTYFIGERNFHQGSQNIFLDRVARIWANDPKNQPVRRWPLPNTITLQWDNLDIRGAEFLTENDEVNPDFIRALPVDTVIQKKIDGEPILFYKIVRWDRMIVLFESVGFLQRAENNLLLYWAIALFAFAFLLYVVAYRIALLTIEPIEEARLYAESYARSLAHEMKTPLAVIQSDLELARLAKNNAKTLLSASGEVTNLRQVVDALLMLSAKQKIQKQLLDIISIFENIWKEKQVFFSREDLSYTWEWDHLELYTDPILAKIFFSNLVENIMKYSLPGVVEIRTSASKIEIQNPAKTLSKKEVANIFDPFISYGGKWTGIGLSLISQIAESNHWKVSARQKDGKMIMEVQIEV